MGKRGPAPKPTALKLLECEINHAHTSTCFNSRRMPNKKEANVPTAVLKPPATLSKRAQAEWRRMVPQLAGVGLCTAIDEMSLFILFDAWDQMMTLRAKIKKEGYSYVTKNTGYHAQYPHVAAWRACVEIVRKQLNEFGMTPSARSRIEVEMRLPTAPVANGEDQSSKQKPQQDEFFRTDNRRA